ncbi:MAG: hypothetical protein AAFS10_27670 [Myxococcota bacterium]
MVVQVASPGLAPSRFGNSVYGAWVMVEMRMRPRFEAEAVVGPEKVAAQLRAYFGQEGPGQGYPLAIRGRHVEIKIPSRQHHFWSPQLNLELHPTETGTTRVEGLFSPRPDIWTLFIALYAVSGFGGFVAAIFGSAQMTLDQPAVGFWGVLGAVVVAALVYGASLVGQQLSQEQMRRLRTMLDEALEKNDPTAP